MTTDEEMLGFIREFSAKNGYPPTVRELAEGCGVNVSSAHFRLQRLRREGVINVNQGARTITIREQIMKHIGTEEL